MLVVEAEVTVDRSPEEILEWVADLERYRRADTKITRVIHQGPDRVRYRGHLRGIPTPADENVVTLVPGRSLTFTGAPDRWTRRLLDFEGSFTCQPIAHGTRVVHRESFGFKPAPVRTIAEAWLGRWLQREIADEMERLKIQIEAGR